MTVVCELLSKDRSLLEIAKANGKNALRSSARSGHVEIVKALLEMDTQMARRTDKKGQTALHIAVKGTSSEVVKLLLEADPAIVMLPDKSSKPALHVATRTKRPEIINELLCLPDTSANVNALTRDDKTTLDIAEGLPLSEKSSEIKSCLMRCGAVRANEKTEPTKMYNIYLNSYVLQRESFSALRRQSSPTYPERRLSQFTENVVE